MEVLVRFVIIIFKNSKVYKALPFAIKCSVLLLKMVILRNKILYAPYTHDIFVYAFIIINDLVLINYT